MENEFWINMIAYSHAMINPIIYITFNENFKKSFKRLMCCTDDEITYEYSNRKYRNKFYQALHSNNNNLSVTSE